MLYDVIELSSDKREMCKYCGLLKNFQYGYSLFIYFFSFQTIYLIIFNYYFHHTRFRCIDSTRLNFQPTKHLIISVLLSRQIYGKHPFSMSKQFGQNICLNLWVPSNPHVELNVVSTGIVSRAITWSGVGQIISRISMDHCRKSPSVHLGHDPPENGYRLIHFHGQVQ